MCSAECYRGQTARAAEVLGQILELLQQSRGGVLPLLERHGFDPERRQELATALAQFDPSLALRREGGDRWG